MSITETPDRPPPPPFEHWCKVCGDPAGFGYDVALLKDKLGTWYCMPHRPEVWKFTYPIIKLTDRWIERAHKEAHARQNSAVALGYEHYGCMESSVDLNIAGTITECAVAKYLRKPWRPRGIHDPGDVGRIQVRGRRMPGIGDLGIRPPDKDEPPYVLGHVFADNTVQLIGWLYGHEGKNNPALWHERSGCWYNPISTLRPISDLVKLVRETDEYD